MKKRVWIRRRAMVSTVKKSQAIMLFAWRQGEVTPREATTVAAAPRPASASNLRALVAETEIPGPARSPTIRR